MSARPVLVDSCFYIQQKRNGFDPLRLLALTAAQRDLVTCGVVNCEVGRGVREPRVLERFQRFWDVMINVPTDHRLWNETLSLAWMLDRRGIFLPLTDVLIACCAKRVGAAVLTLDQHFYQIPDLHVMAEL